jgi:hypothetical protein
MIRAVDPRGRTAVGSGISIHRVSGFVSSEVERSRLRLPSSEVPRAEQRENIWKNFKVGPA